MRLKAAEIMISGLLLLIFSHSGSAKENNKNEFRVVNDIQVNFNDLSGPGRASSSLTDGTTYLENLNIYARGNQDELKYIFNLGGRTTNDNRYDSAEFALTSLKGHVSYENHQIDAGDIFETGISRKEKSSVSEKVVNENGLFKINRTISGTFLSIE